MSDVHAGPAGSGDVLMDVLRGVGIGPNSVVRVAGRDGLAPLIWLCRKGFQDEGYTCLGAGCAREAGDLLLVLHDPPRSELPAILTRRGWLKECGVLVPQTRDQRALDGSDPVHPLLEAAGFQIERCLLRHLKELHVARRMPSTLRQAA